MIERFHVQGYKALRDVALDLTPLHVLIGPNDSGKTSFLEAIAALCQSVDLPLTECFPGPWQGGSLVWSGSPERGVSFTARVALNGDRFDYGLACKFHPVNREVRASEETFRSASLNLVLSDGDNPWSKVNRLVSSEEPRHESKTAALAVHHALTGAQFYRWDPRFLAMPVAMGSTRKFRIDPSGFGLVLCLDDILGYDRQRFNMLEDRFREIFPHVKAIRLIRQSAYLSAIDGLQPPASRQHGDGKGLYFEFAPGNQVIAAAQVSDGLLLVLAYLTVLYLPQPPRVLLIEEPENGIHPKRLQDVLKILRTLIAEQAHSQVILTTHSPYVVDLFQPEEVTLCQKQADGSVAVRKLSDSKTVREQLDVFTLGEIWTAEGDEALAQPGLVDQDSPK
ncbi:MAG: AAA family ATPase [Pirellulales bacterium]